MRTIAERLALAGHPDTVDPEALRRWFTDELSGAAEQTWFTNMARTSMTDPR